jgi:hypothetical protein
LSRRFHFYRVGNQEHIQAQLQRSRRQLKRQLLRSMIGKCPQIISAGMKFPARRFRRGAR